MITERQIRARFGKAHLRKLAREMLQEEFYDYHNRKRDEHPSKLYTLRNGVTIDDMANGVRFHSLEVPNPESRYTKLYGEVYWKRHYGKWMRSDYLRLRKIPDTVPQAYEINPVEGYDRSKYPTEADVIDRWIKSDLLDAEEFVKNNSAITIYI